MSRMMLSTTARVPWFRTPSSARSTTERSTRRSPRLTIAGRGGPLVAPACSRTSVDAQGRRRARERHRRRADDAARDRRGRPPLDGDAAVDDDTPERAAAAGDRHATERDGRLGRVARGVRGDDGDARPSAGIGGGDAPDGDRLVVASAPATRTSREPRAPRRGPRALRARRRPCRSARRRRPLRRRCGGRGTAPRAQRARGEPRPRRGGGAGPRARRGRPRRPRPRPRGASRRRAPRRGRQGRALRGAAGIPPPARGARCARGFRAGAGRARQRRSRALACRSSAAWGGARRRRRPGGTARARGPRERVGRRRLGLAVSRRPEERLGDVRVERGALAGRLARVRGERAELRERVAPGPPRAGEVLAREGRGRGPARGGDEAAPRVRDAREQRGACTGARGGAMRRRFAARARPWSPEGRAEPRARAARGRSSRPPDRDGRRRGVGTRAARGGRRADRRGTTPAPEGRRAPPATRRWPGYDANLRRGFESARTRAVATSMFGSSSRTRREHTICPRVCHGWLDRDREVRNVAGRAPLAGSFRRGCGPRGPRRGAPRRSPARPGPTRPLRRPRATPGRRTWTGASRARARGDRSARGKRRRRGRRTTRPRGRSPRARLRARRAGRACECAAGRRTCAASVRGRARPKTDPASRRDLIRAAHSFVSSRRLAVSAPAKASSSPRAATVVVHLGQAGSPRRPDGVLRRTGAPWLEATRGRLALAAPAPTVASRRGPAPRREAPLSPRARRPRRRRRRTRRGRPLRPRGPGPCTARPRGSRTRPDPRIPGASARPVPAAAGSRRPGARSDPGARRLNATGASCRRDAPGRRAPSHLCPPLAPRSGPSRPASTSRGHRCLPCPPSRRRP